MSWELIEKDRSLITGDINELGTKSGINIADKGLSDSTILTIDQIPSHKHGVQHGRRPEDQGGSDIGIVEPGNNIASYTTNTGGGKGHDHALNIKSIRLHLYKRIS